MVITSPISHSSNVRFIQRYPTTELIQRWQQNLNMDITSELHGHSAVELYECLDTGLYFFVPLDTAGSETLYQELQKLDYYYIEDKWEYDQAVQLLPLSCPELKVLEVGCGRGYFVNKLKQIGVEVVGLELNQSAVNYAQAHHLPVHRESLENWTQKYPQQYTVICSFQVLEHIAQPKEFIQQCLNSLAPNGQLILGVPNGKSFTRYLEYNLLDMPPHHMTRWHAKAFQSLENYFPMTLEGIFYEPLATYHVDWYVNLQMDRLWQLPNPRQSFGHKIIYKITKPIYTKLLQFILNSGLRKFIQGHSLLASFRKL
ncbi:class I SAM-dependent methyltransferase [Gloeomargaritales cyanobacterium VI4D9]|nr:class I SAM-dependent methyltransferase [Gloeomargaritales cyanobacterium VI4D9]